MTELVLRSFAEDMRWPWLRRGASMTLLALGAFLLGMTCVGWFFTTTRAASASADTWDHLDRDLVRRTKNVTQLLQEARRRTPGFGDASAEAKMRALFDITSKRFVRIGAPVRYGLLSNWILDLLGHFNEASGIVHDPDRILRLGRNGSCDQVSYVLLQLALRAGLPARHVAMEGHVVMEAWYDDDWHMYDPSMEVIPLRPDGRVYSLEDLSRDQQSIRRAYKNLGELDVEAMVQSIGDRRHHSFVSYPEGAYFVWKVEVLCLLQAVAEWLKYLIPSSMLVAGWWLWRSDGSTAASRPSEGPRDNLR